MSVGIVFIRGKAGLLLLLHCPSVSCFKLTLKGPNLPGQSLFRGSLTTPANAHSLLIGTQKGLRREYLTLGFIGILAWAISKLRKDFAIEATRHYGSTHNDIKTIIIRLGKSWGRAHNCQAQAERC
jgi:hypothetical protein